MCLSVTYLYLSPHLEYRGKMVPYYQGFCQLNVKCPEQFWIQFNNYWLLLALILGRSLFSCYMDGEVKYTVALTSWNLTNVD